MDVASAGSSGVLRLPGADEIIALHDRIVAEFGGEPGLAGRGPVESALERARWGPFVVADLAERAAFLVRGIVQDHPFVDGNKRTGFAAAESFLRLNGAGIEAADGEVVDFMLDVAQGKLSVEQIASWLPARQRRI